MLHVTAPSTPKSNDRRRSRSLSPSRTLAEFGSGTDGNEAEEKVATWSYKPRRADELAFSKHDIVQLLSSPFRPLSDDLADRFGTIDDGWAVGRVKGGGDDVCGLVPLNYLSSTSAHSRSKKVFQTPSPARSGRSPASRAYSSPSPCKTRQARQFEKYGKVAGNATDAIFIFNASDAYADSCFSTDINCVFRGPSGKGSKHEGEPIEVYIDGTFRFAMRLGAKGVVEFEDGTKKIPAELAKRQKCPSFSSRAFTVLLFSTFYTTMTNFLCATLKRSSGFGAMIRISLFQMSTGLSRRAMSKAFFEQQLK